MRYYIDEHPEGWIVRKRWFLFSKVIYIGSDFNKAITIIRNDRQENSKTNSRG